MVHVDGEVQDVDRKRKYPRRDPTTAEAKAQYAAVQQQVTEWHKGDPSEKTLVVAKDSSSRERMVAYNALEALSLGDKGSQGFYVEKVQFCSALLHLDNCDGRVPDKAGISCN